MPFAFSEAEWAKAFFHKNFIFEKCALYSFSLRKIWKKGKTWPEFYFLYRMSPYSIKNSFQTGIFIFFSIRWWMNETYFCWILLLTRFFFSGVFSSFLSICTSMICFDECCTQQFYRITLNWTCIHPFFGNSHMMNCYILSNFPQLFSICGQVCFVSFEFFPSHYSFVQFKLELESVKVVET